MWTAPAEAQAVVRQDDPIREFHSLGCVYGVRSVGLG